MLDQLVLTIANNYNVVAYHNFSHAFSLMLVNCIIALVELSMFVKIGHIKAVVHRRRTLLYSLSWVKPRFKSQYFG